MFLSIFIYHLYIVVPQPLTTLIPIMVIILMLKIDLFSFIENCQTLCCIFQPSDYNVIALLLMTLSCISQKNSETVSWNEPRLVNPVMCIPVRPGKSRVISLTTRNFATWADKFIPRWYIHIGHNLVMDSDLFLLHAQVLHF